MGSNYCNTDEIMLRDGTRFTRTPVGTYGGLPTPGQVAEIQGNLSDQTRIALVCPKEVGGVNGFELDYFLRET